MNRRARFFDGVERLVRRTVIATGKGLIVVALLVWGFEVVLWLQDARWYHFSPASVFGALTVPGWRGVEMIARWLWDVNFGIYLVLIGWCLCHISDARRETTAV